MIGIVPRGFLTSGILFLVQLSLGQFYVWPASDVPYQEVHEDILAVLTLFDRLVKERTQPMRVQVIIISVINGSSGQDDGVIVGPFGRVSPRILQSQSIVKKKTNEES